MRKRNILPISLIGSGLFLLVGCIYIPYFGATGQTTASAGHEVTLLGGRFTKERFQEYYVHKFKIGVSTRDQVLAEMLGPEYGTENGLSIVYQQERTDGYLVWPTCFFITTPDRETYFIQLDFGPDGRLLDSRRVTRGFNMMWRYPSQSPGWPPSLSST